MCGRFAFYSPSEATAALFDVVGALPVEARYNIAPSQYVAAIRNGEDGARHLAMLRWGLVPFWAKDTAIGNRMINARSETVDEKPSFRNAFKSRRCLIPADGFYEWQRTDEGKRPHRIAFSDGRPFAFAGLWEHWQDDNGNELESCVILVRPANAQVAPIHDRMPVILPAARYDEWLDPENRHTESLNALLQPYPATEMKAYPVTTFVNSPHHEGPDCVRSLDP